MSIQPDINHFIQTANLTFNKFAFKLYLNNVKAKTFADTERALTIFKFICDLMCETGGLLFTFIQGYEAYLSKANLTDEENRFICRILKEYLEFLIAKKTAADYLECYNDYLDYFTALQEIATEKLQAKQLAEKDIITTTHEIIGRQILSISAEMELLPAEKRMKMLASLVRILAQYQKASEPKKTGTKPPVTKTQSTDSTYLNSHTNGSATTEVATVQGTDILPRVLPTTAAGHNYKQPYK
ncbi:MAG: hypothetical protein H7257_04580, partial [Taibaiella sp.]|nr:hypothetical protein [Taibaiella sp.]